MAKKFLRLIISMLIFAVVLAFLFLTEHGLNIAWPAENAIQTEEDYIVVMEQAETWPIVGKNHVMFNLIGKIHQDPQNPDRNMVSLWFVNKNNHYDLEMFAKILFSPKSNKSIDSLAAALKIENGKWIMGDFLIRSEVKYNGEDAIAFRIFSNKDRNNPIAIRTFLLKNLSP